MTQFMPLLQLIYQLILILPLLWLSQRLWIFITPYDDHKIIRETKLSPSGILLAGYLLAVAVIMILVFHGETFDYLSDTVTIFSMAILANLCLLLAFYLSSKAFAKKYTAQDYKVFYEIESGNFAVAVYLLFLLVSTAVQLVVANYGKEIDFYTWILVVLPYFLIGQLIILTSTFLFQKASFYEGLKNGNLAIAISYGALLLSISLVVGKVLYQVEIFDAESVFLVLLYSFLYVTFLSYVPEKFSTVILKKELTNEIIAGNIDFALVQGVVKVIFAIVIIHSMNFSLV